MTSERLSSRKNPRVQALRKLHAPSGRRDAGRFLAEGRNALETALDAGAIPVEVWVSPRLARAERGEALREALEAAGCPVVEATDEVLAALTEARGHQGVVGVFPLPAPPPDPAALYPRPLVLLADLQDPGNVGTIRRTLAAAGGGVMLCGEGGADPHGPKAVRAAAGATFLVPAHRMALDPDLLGSLAAAGYDLVAADARGAEAYHEASWEAPLALVVGQEGGGVPTGWLEACTRTVRIPMAAGVESLNAAQGATLLLYEAARRRSFAPLDPGGASGTLGVAGRRS